MASISDDKQPSQHNNGDVGSSQDVPESQLSSPLDDNRPGLLGWRRRKAVACWAIAHITHWCMYLGNLASLVMIIIYCKWYIALPMVTILGNPIIGGLHCAYNNLENRYRAQLGWPLIDHNFLPTVLQDISSLIHKWKNRS